MEEEKEKAGTEEKQEGKEKETSGKSRESETVKEIKEVFNFEQLKATIESALHESTVRRIKIKNRDGRVVVDVPLWLAAAGGVGAIWAFLPVAIVGLIASIAAGVTVEIERVKEEGQKED